MAVTSPSFTSNMVVSGSFRGIAFTLVGVLRVLLFAWRRSSCAASQLQSRPAGRADLGRLTHRTPLQSSRCRVMAPTTRNRRQLSTPKDLRLLAKAASRSSQMAAAKILPRPLAPEAELGWPAARRPTRLAALENRLAALGRSSCAASHPALPPSSFACAWWANLARIFG